jgi:dockerin type I repeat protein
MRRIPLVWSIILSLVSFASPSFGSAGAIGERPARVIDSIERVRQEALAAAAKTTVFHVEGVLACSDGDYNGNGTLDAGDLSIWIHLFVDCVTPLSAECARADLDGDGNINARDLSIWINLWITCP